MSADRLFQIVDLLLEQERMTADGLAEALGVSVRTVYRDVEALSTAGVPVCTTQGKGGGVALMDGYVLDQSAFSREEQRLLLGALREFPQQGEEQVLTKLAVLFRRREEDWIHADLSRWGSIGQENETFQLLRQAIWSRHEVRFVYGDPNESPYPRQILPARLVYLNRAWHLQGYDMEKEDYRMFRLSRILSLSISENVFRRKLNAPEIDPAGNIPPLFRVEATLKFPPAMAHDVYDEFASNGISVQADGSLVVSAVFQEDRQLYSYLLSFGPGMEILAPLSLREQVARLAEEIKETNSHTEVLGEGYDKY